ncbi:methylamine utilization protein MauJ [Deinococcus radiopugnans]|uniref:methylamine utilization protein MauJ n=1 Tax=Deinococcus radiopugnans TaxID=57497 RepID=UPI00360A1980
MWLGKKEPLSENQNVTEPLSKIQNATEPLSETPNPLMSATMDRPYGSTWLWAQAVFIYHDKPETTAIGGAGIYDVMITLMHPTMSIFRTNIVFKDDGIMGDSLLILENDMEITDSRPHGSYSLLLLRNDQGRLGLVKLRITESDFTTAEVAGMGLAQPFLSLLSVTHNISLSVHAVTIREQATGAIIVSSGVAGQEKYVNIQNFSNLPVITEEPIAHIFSAYREALNAQDPFQKIISFWRVFEGLKRARDSMIRATPVDKRKDLFSKHKLPALIEDLPERYRLDAARRPDLFARILGKSHQDAIEQFTSEYRDAVAHLRLDDKKDGTSRPIRFADSWGM